MTTPITLVLEYFHPWPNSAGFYVAREAGWYAEHDIDLEIRTVDPGVGDSLEHVVRGRADLAVFPTNRLLVRAERGEPLHALGAVNQRGLETVRTLEQSGIRSLADLEGRRLALNPTPRGLAIVRDLVHRAGGDFDRIELVDAGVRELTVDDLVNGVADATFGSYWAWDILVTERPDVPERTWRVDDELGIRYHSYLLGGGPAAAGLPSDVVAGFLEATARGFARAAADPEATTDLFSTVTPYFERDVLRRSVEAIAPTWFHDGRWGAIRAEAMDPYAAWMRSHGLIADAAGWRRTLSAGARTDLEASAA